MKKNDHDTAEDRIHLKQSEEETELFRKADKKRGTKTGIIGMLLLAYIVVFLFSILLLVEYSAGARWQFSAAYIFRIVRQNFSNLYNFIIGNGAPGGIDYQLIRYLVVGLSGASLAACGALLQGTFRNILAGPSTMGIQSGGMLGNMIYVLAFCSSTETVTVMGYDEIAELAGTSTFWERNTQQILVFAGCLFGVLFVAGIALAAGKGKVSSSAMILAGTVFSSIIGNFCSLIQYYIMVKNPSDSRIYMIRSLSMGSLDRAYSFEHLCSMAAIILPCILILLLISGRMNILSLGEDMARTMGMNVMRYKMVMIAVSTLMTAVITASVGQIGFIGFMVPQIAVKTVGPDFRRLFPASVVTGALLMTLIYDAARVTGMTDSLNLFTSAVGSIAMLVILLRRKGGSRS